MVLVILILLHNILIGLCSLIIISESYTYHMVEGNYAIEKNCKTEHSCQTKMGTQARWHKCMTLTLEELSIVINTNCKE